jgi:hypothetical protein
MAAMTVLGKPGGAFPKGLSEYRLIRRQGYAFVDKTAFIADVLDSGASTTLFTRPRRFGKTLNLLMLRDFLERGNEDVTDVFEDTEIWHLPGNYRQHFRRYPVIWLSFRDVGGATWEETETGLAEAFEGEVDRLTDLYPGLRKHRETLLSRERQPFFLKRLSRLLFKLSGERVVILIDEYDSPLHGAWLGGYWHKAVSLFRRLFSGGLKDAPHLWKGVVTGVLRVAKESLFSGLNNFDVIGLTEDRSASRFGFVESEVEALAERGGLADDMPELRRWYNGYRVGGLNGVTIYNPWSVIARLASPTHPCAGYWLGTSSNDLARDLMTRTAATNGELIRRLIAGESVEVQLPENVALQDLYADDALLWPLLCFAGYLTPERLSWSEEGLTAWLRIPNVEVRAAFTQAFLPLAGQSARPGGPLTQVSRALLEGDVGSLRDALTDVMVRALSYHDLAPGSPLVRVESIYHAFILGLLLHLGPHWHVKSNLESGHGRPDVLIWPKQGKGPGVAMEFKVLGRGETVETGLSRALEQLDKRDYAATLREAGCDPIHELGVVFDGKLAWVASRSGS